MTRASLLRLAPVLAGLAAAGAARLLAPAAAAALPAAVGLYVGAAALRCFKSGDPPRAGWLLVGLAALAAALDLSLGSATMITALAAIDLSLGSATMITTLAGTLLLCAGLWRIERGVARSALATPLPARWRLAVAGSALATLAALALADGAPWPARVGAVVLRAATVAAAVRLLGLALPLRAAGRPLAYLAASALVLALDVVPAAARATGPGGLPGWLGWSAVGLAAWSLRELRRAARERLTAAREAVILRKH